MPIKREISSLFGSGVNKGMSQFNTSSITYKIDNLGYLEGYSYSSDDNKGVMLKMNKILVVILIFLIGN